MIRITTLMLCLTACKKAPPDYTMTYRAADQRLEGVWKSDGGMLATIENGAVVSLVDYDDEVFEVLSSGWEAQGFAMHYLVPSTEYRVNILLTSIDYSALQYAWDNVTPSGDTNEGTGYFERVK